ncbi:MAG: PAS domain S-box protein, partial [Chloroflexi bacterium]|nr:PAS domain S-box protein [Chloroflexota bacterium]
MRKAWPVALAVLGVAGLIWIALAGRDRRADLDPRLREWLSTQGSLSLAVSSDRPPYGSFDRAERYVGHDADLASGLAMVLGLELRLLPLSDAEALRLLREGQVDAVLGQAALDSDSGGRISGDLVFTRPYLSSALSLFLPPEQVGVVGLGELQGQLVAVMRGSLAERVLVERGIPSFPVASVEEGLLAVDRRQVAAFLGEENETLHGLRSLDLDLKLAGEPVIRLNYAIATRSEEEQLREAFDFGLGALQEMGLLSEIERRWFGLRPGAQPVSPAPSLTPWLALTVLVLAAASGALVWTRSLRREVAQQRRALLDVRDKYRKLLESANDAILTVNPGDGSLLEVNQRVEDLTGYGKGELLTMDLNRLLSLKDRRRALEGLQGVLLSGSGRVEDLSLVRRDGASLAVELNAHVVAYDNRRVIQCIVRDVTERKEMRRELLERNLDLATINSIASLVSRFVDLEEVLTQVLDQVLGLMKMEAGAIYLREEFAVHPGDREAREGAQHAKGTPGGGLRLLIQRPNPEGGGDLDGLSLAAQAVARGETLLISDLASDPQLEGMRARRGGFASLASVPLKAKEEVLGVMNLYGQAIHHFTPEDRELLGSIGNQIGIALESARLFQRLNRTVRELSAVRQFNESILQSMSDGLLVVDARGRVSLANRAAEVILGYPGGEVEGMESGQLLGSGEVYVRECLTQGVTILRREVEVEKGGRKIPLGLSISPLRGEAGTVSGVVVVFSDLSEARAMEEERRRLDRLALLGEMSAVVAHEIRNPLAGIGAGLQHMLGK